MIEATHIVKVPGFKPPEVIDLMDGYSADLFVIRITGKIQGPSADTQEEAIAEWNSIFGKGVA